MECGIKLKLTLSIRKSIKNILWANIYLDVKLNFGAFAAFLDGWLNSA